MVERIFSMCFYVLIYNTQAFQFIFTFQIEFLSYEIHCTAIFHNFVHCVIYCDMLRDDHGDPIGTHHVDITPRDNNVILKSGTIMTLSWVKNCNTVLLNLPFR